MANQEIVSYIQKQLGLNVSREVIYSDLKKVGWSDEVLNEAFGAISQNTNSAPVFQPVQQQSQMVINNDDLINSPYSKMLAVVLVISLLIITNGIFSDIKSAFGDTNKMLLYEGLFVIPFLLIAFILHGSLRDINNRFRILSMPYFAISAWILLRLLWKVGESIWKANSAIGVYVVLGMVVVVLTCVIIFVQKYIKK